MRTRSAARICAALLLGALSLRHAAAVERPFVLWTSAELEAIRERIETQGWARAEWERKPENRAEASLRDLLAHRLFGDREAGERQKERLLKVVRSRPPLGGAQWLIVVTFDMAHDLLAEGERDEVEAAFRRFIEHAVFRNSLFDPDVFDTSRNYQRYDALYYTRSNWLPNITWPRRVSANLMAAALADEPLIRKVWGCYGSWQWYFDEYLAGIGFYGEEFSKMGATPGEMLVYCRAVRNLGLDELGFGYRGRSGSSMIGHIESLLRLGYPRVELHSGRPHYPMLTTGDLRGDGSSRQGRNLPTFAFQHSIARGCLPGSSGGGIHRWQAHGAWGGEMRGRLPQWDGYSDFTPKMMVPFWFEIAHRESPRAGFDYFLAQMRAPDEERYRPSIYFGVEPISPSDAKPPPSLSWVARDRGLALLRADESPAYWKSPAPAVGVRLGANYAHNVNDSFSLSGFYALSRPIFLNRQTRRGYAFGYSRSVLSHCGVMVDGGEPGFTDHVVTRCGFHPDVKFLAFESPEVYPGVDACRALMLTSRYLLDVFFLAGREGADHDFIWVVHALGQAESSGSLGPEKAGLGGPLAVFGDARPLLPADETAEVTVIQRLALDDVTTAKLPREWYDRQVGVRIAVRAGEGAELFAARTPVDDPENRPLEDPAARLELEEVGGTSIIAARRGAAAAAFVALYVPFEGGKPPPLRLVEHAASDPRVKAVEVVDERGGACRDAMLLDFRPEQRRREPFSVEIPERGTITFSSHAWVRIEGEQVRAWGDLRGLRLRIGAAGEAPAFTLNGRITRFALDRGELVFPPPKP